MAIDDINFQEGDGQAFILEIPLGTLNSPEDILAESDGNLLVMEVPEQSGVFIMMD